MSDAMSEALVKRAGWGGAGLALAILLAPRPAGAQQLYVTGPLAGAPSVYKREYDEGSKGGARLVRPSGHLEVAGEMAFITSRASPYAERLLLTDMALLRLNVRRSFADWLEVYAGGSLLPKQPTSTHATAVQGGHVGAQAELAKGFSAALGASMGPLFGSGGLYYRGGPALNWKTAVSEYLRFVVGIGNAWTLLDYRGTTRSFWLGEAMTHAETQFGDENASMWVGMDYAMPFASRPQAAAADPEHGYLDPQVRLNLEVGGTMSVRADGWNVYAIYTFVDRGELAKPETTLPILDGGFDQQQVTIGVQYRFDPKRRGEQ